MEFANAANQIEEYAKNEYTLLIKRGAAEVAQIRGGVDQVVLQIATDAQAIIETKIGTIMWNGAPIAETDQYKSVIAALHKALGEQPQTKEEAQAAAATPAPVNDAPVVPSAAVSSDPSVAPAPTAETVAPTADPIVTTQTATIETVQQSSEVSSDTEQH